MIGEHDVAGTVDGAGTNYYLFLEGIRQRPRIDKMGSAIQGRILQADPRFQAVSRLSRLDNGGTLGSFASS
jgi:hypothetical protein